jgi:hypothetical protein
MKKNKFLRKLYDYFVEHWFLSGLITASPAFLFALIQIFGNNVGIYNQGMLTFTASLILWPLFIILAAFSFLLAYADRYDEKAKKDGQFIYALLLECVNTITETKLRRFTRYINTHKTRRGVNPFFDITQPNTQMESILENIRIAFSKMFGISRDNIGLSIVYKTDENASWGWLNKMNIGDDLTLDELLNNPNSAVRQIIDKKTGFLFFPDKKVGIERNQYVPGEKDKATDNLGSIICKKISTNTDNCIQAILCVTTYGCQICDENDSETREKINLVLLPTFERRIQVELALLYTKEVIASQPNISSIQAIRDQ